MLLAFDGIARPIALEDCEDLHRCLANVLRGWPFEEVAPNETEPVITLRKRRGKYRLKTPELGPPEHRDSDASAVCAFIADLVQIYVSEQPSLLCLHCGAAAFAGGLVIFPSYYRAGKSTLLGRLAAAGVSVFADDVLPLAHASDRAVALGVAPRLRLPLPDDADAPFRGFVQAHRGLSDGRYLYLDLPTAALAQHGSQAPIAACVLLDRRSSGDAELEPLAKSLGLRRLILQNFARSIPASSIAANLRRLVDRVPCFTLHYSNLEGAVALLQGAFQERPFPTSSNGTAPATAPGGPSSPEVLPASRRPRRTPGQPLGALYYRRDPVVQSHIVDGDGFLVDPRSQSIFHLNAVALGLWRLMREPTTAAEAVEVLRGAFPEVPQRQIKRDVRALLSQLLARKMILPQQPGNAKGDCNGC